MLLVRGTLRPIAFAISPVLVFTLGEQGDDGKRHRVTEKTTESRLPIGYLFHGSDAYHVFGIAKT
jgi:hypothetical protein